LPDKQIAQKNKPAICRRVLYFSRTSYFLSLTLGAVEWLFACPDKGIEDDSCSLLSSLGVACVDPLASPLPVVAPGPAAGVLASDGGIAVGGAATEPPLSTLGTGGVSAFLQPIKSIAKNAETRMERV